MNERHVFKMRVQLISIGKWGKTTTQSTKKEGIVNLSILLPISKLLKVAESTVLTFCNNGLQGSALIK